MGRDDKFDWYGPQAKKLAKVITAVAGVMSLAALVFALVKDHDRQVERQKLIEQIEHAAPVTQERPAQESSAAQETRVHLMAEQAARQAGEEAGARAAQGQK